MLIQHITKVRARELPNWFLKIFSLFDKPTRMIIGELGFCAIISNDKLKRDLKIQPISTKKPFKQLQSRWLNYTSFNFITHQQITFEKN